MSILPLSEMTCLPHNQGVRTSGFVHVIAKGPGSHLPRHERQQRRAVTRSLRTRSDGRAPRATTLLLDEPGTSQWLRVRHNRWWIRVLSHLLAPSLDRQLSEGRPPESGLLLAARAQALVSPARRQTLAYSWTDLLDRARTPPEPRDPRASINRASILAHEPELRALLDLLVAPGPGRARGVAVMSWLLSNGAGPLYNPRCSDALRASLLEATALLDPVAL